MTSRERMQLVLTGKLPDRVPFFPTIYVDHACAACEKRFEDAIVNPAEGQRCMLGAARRYGTDVVRFCMGPDASWYEEKLVVEREGKLVQLSRQSGQEEGMYDVNGGGKFIPYKTNEPILTLSKVREIEVPKMREYLDRGCMKDVIPNVQAAHRDELFVVGMCPAPTIAFMIEKTASPETALMLFYDDPELALALIHKSIAISIEKGKAFIQAGVDCLYFGDSYVSGSVVSPEIFKRFLIPAYRQMAQEFHREGILCYMHCCGNYDPFLDMLTEIGMDAMDGIDPTSGMSVKHTKQRIGKDMTLMGGLSCLTVLNGTSEEVFQEAGKCITEGKPGGRYTLGTACAVPRFSPPENLLATRKAVELFGYY